MPLFVFIVFNPTDFYVDEFAILMKSLRKIIIGRLDDISTLRSLTKDIQSLLTKEPKASECSGKTKGTKEKIYDCRLREIKRLNEEIELI